MTRRVYVSCDSDERELLEIESLCKFLQQAGCTIEFAPNGFWDYRLIEEAIERCDAFVAGIGASYSCSTWLAHEISYAFGLRRLRMRLRPRVFAVRLSNYTEPTFVEKFTENYPVEWVTEENYQILLNDSPKKF